ncbi:MAG: MBL fold metallo-hydrolase [Erysipelotrichaceae bacterium]|nr:MBL fold metallo-hydrolase [Erysipelotrichaceae bacterium]
MKITFFGTTTLLFDDGRDQILFDCHFTRPSLLKYIAGSEATDEKLVDEMIAKHHIDRLQAIFVSHTHHDRVMDAPYMAKMTGAKVYGTSFAANVCKGGNVPEDQIGIFKTGETHQVGDYQITILKSLHSKPTILNNDLGQTIDAPLVQPEKLRNYKEGGSYDFYVRHKEKTYLIRPSFNYIERQLDGYKADVLFLGVAGLAKADEATEEIFFRLDQPTVGMPSLIEKTPVVFFKMAKYCEEHGIDFLVQIPRTSITF